MVERDVVIDHIIKQLADKNLYRGGLVIICYKRISTGETWNKYAWEKEYHRLMFEEELLNKGVSLVDITRHRELVAEEIEEEIAYAEQEDCMEDYL